MEAGSIAVCKHCGLTVVRFFGIWLDGSMSGHICMSAGTPHALHEVDAEENPANLPHES